VNSFFVSGKKGVCNKLLAVG
jgi:hypothetical protein